MGNNGSTSELSSRLLRLVIVGHVDHGKSTLVGRLLSDTGALPEGKLDFIRDICKQQGKEFEFAFLLDALEDESVEPNDVLLQTDVRGLSLIPAGPKRPLSAELYSSSRMVGFLDKVVSQFPSSVIVFDAPPVLATGEPSALAQNVGQIVFVVEAEKTGKAAISEALKLVNVCPNIGFVLNKAQFRFGSVRFGNYYDYYYR